MRIRIHIIGNYYLYGMGCFLPFFLSLSLFLSLALFMDSLFLYQDGQNLNMQIIRHGILYTTR